MRKIMFAQFVKVNEATGEFTGIAAEEIPDQAGEIFDYEASKPLIKAWSDDSFKHSGGKSRGNLRAMHDPKRAAGLLTAVVFNDAAKRVEVSGQVVDTEEKAKLAKGVYTGLSFGGSYAWRKPDGIHVRYAAKPVELSLADKPCVPTARFTLVKADGSEVETSFEKSGTGVGGTGVPPVETVQKVAEREDTNPKEGEKKYGDVKFADAKNKKYPIDTVAHIRAAWNYINKAKNAAKYDAADLASIKRKIIAAWKKKIDKEGPPSAEKVGAGSPGPGRRDAAPTAPGGETPPLQKAGARHNKADQDHIQAVHDHSVSLGADCAAEKVSTGETPVPPDLAKTLQAKDEELAKAAAEMETVRADLAKVTGENEALGAEVEKLKAEPARAKGALKAVPKEADTLNKTTEPEKPLTALEEVAAARQKPFLIR